MGLIKKDSTSVTPLIQGIMPEGGQGGQRAVIVSSTRYGKPLSAYDMEVDRRIHVSGILQAVASSSAIMPFVLRVEDYSKVVEQETRKLLQIAQTLVEGK